jgi:hypothetical protein
MFDVRELPRQDQALIGLGALALLASFLPWYGFSVAIGQIGSIHWSHNAWHGGLAALGLILVLAATVVVAMQGLGVIDLPQLPVPWPVAIAIVDGLGALLVVINSFNLPSVAGPYASLGLRWGGWLLIVTVLAHAILAVVRAQTRVSRG